MVACGSDADVRAMTMAWRRSAGGIEVALGLAMTTPPDKAKPPMRNPNIDTTAPEKEKGDADPRRGRVVERPQGPGETGPDMIPPGQVRTGRGADGPDAGKGDDGDDERDGELDDSVDLPASEQDTGRYAQPAMERTRGDNDASGTRSPTRGDDASERGSRDPRR